MILFVVCLAGICGFIVGAIVGSEYERRDWERNWVKTRRKKV